jgi:two-component system, LytTR family, response regulator
VPSSPEPLRAILADDEPLARRRLRALLAHEPDVAVVAESANGPETVDLVQSHAPDVLFLDVGMPGASGIQVLEALGPGAVGAVVLVTAHDGYAVAAFRHHALDYVLKPVDEDRFRDTVQRVRTRIRHDRAAALADQAARHLSRVHRRAGAGEEPYLTRFLVRSGQKVTVVDVGEIDWMEADGDYLRLHAGTRVHLHRATMGSVEARLDPAEWVRIHRGTLVRLSRVKELEPYFHGDHSLTLVDGTRLRLSRTYRARFQAAFGQAI